MSPFDWQSWVAPLPPSDDVVKALRPGATVAVYGTGTVSQDVIKTLAHHQVRVRYVIDAKSTRSEVSGIPVLRPDDPSITTQDRASMTVVVAIFNAFVDIPAVIEGLNAVGWKRVIDFLELHALWNDEFGDRYWLTRRSFIQEHTVEIAATDALWADSASRDLYRQLLRFRVTGVRTGMSPPDRERPYFAADVPPWPSPLRMVDCGACDGDTLQTLEKLKLSVGALALFEPDPANFSQLAAKAADFESRRIPALGWPCAVSDTTKQLRFSSNRGAASALDSAGDIVIPAVALDDVLAGFSPNLIKMDIEGAEQAALAGARRLIEHHRPGLAICAYHRPDDLWTLPALVNSWHLDYRLYLRAHQYSDFDVVLYAIQDR